MPETTVDPVVAGSSIVMALQTLVSRSIGPREAAVVTVGSFHSGSAANVIPREAVMEVSLRSTYSSVRERLRERLEQIVTTQAESFGALASFDWATRYLETTKDPAAAARAEETIIRHFGSDAFVPREQPFMGSDDFSFMLEKVAGAYVLIGNGHTAGPHTPEYDFNDDIIERGPCSSTSSRRTFLRRAVLPRKLASPPRSTPDNN